MDGDVMVTYDAAYSVPYNDMLCCALMYSMNILPCTVVSYEITYYVKILPYNDMMCCDMMNNMNILPCIDMMSYKVTYSINILPCDVMVSSDDVMVSSGVTYGE